MTSWCGWVFQVNSKSEVGVSTISRLLNFSQAVFTFTGEAALLVELSANNQNGSHLNSHGMFQSNKIISPVPNHSAQ